MEIQRRVKWENITPKLGTWAPHFYEFYEKGEFDKLFKSLQERSKNHRVIPDSSIAFRVFTEVPVDKVKVFIFGLCPYHTMIEKTVIADGLALSCGITKILQPSLSHFYNALETEFEDGLCLPCKRDPDLSYLAKQGVFLGNVSLTTEYLKVFKHGEIWKPFSEFFIDKVIGTQFTNVPVVFLGKEASKFYGYLAPFQWNFQISHPASASYSGETWDSEGVFKKVNNILKDQGKEEINWLNS